MSGSDPTIDHMHPDDRANFLAGRPLGYVTITAPTKIDPSHPIWQAIAVTDSATEAWQNILATVTKTQPTKTRDAGALEARITDYLTNGGLFNPEIMDHREICSLLRDCRDVLAALPAQAEPVAWRVDAMTETTGIGPGPSRIEIAFPTVEDMQAASAAIRSLRVSPRVYTTPPAPPVEAEPVAWPVKLETLRETVKMRALQRRCGTCLGTGHLVNPTRGCPECKGAGFLAIPPSFFVEVGEVNCPRCWGAGYVEARERPCKQCGGTGSVPNDATPPAPPAERLRGPSEGYKLTDTIDASGRVWTAEPAPPVEAGAVLAGQLAERAIRAEYDAKAARLAGLEEAAEIADESRGSGFEMFNGGWLGGAKHIAAAIRARIAALKAAAAGEG